MNNLTPLWDASAASIPPDGVKTSPLGGILVEELDFT